MGYVYESLFFARRNLGDDLAQPEVVGRHVGSVREYLAHCRRVCAAAVKAGPAGVRQVVPHILAWIADPRTLRSAWDYLAREGGPAPGPNGLRFNDLADHEVWGLCRSLGRAIRDGTYRPGPERERRILKGSGRGFRTLRIRNIEDRVVERAVVVVTQPLLDPLFLPCSFGFRPGLDRLHALAQAERTTVDEARWVWLTEDLKDAFDQVPQRRLLDLVRKYLRAPDLVQLIAHVIHTDTGRGLRQGSPLSPLLLLTYLHHHVDRPWSERAPGLPPLIRVADDLLVLGRSAEEAQDARAYLERLLTPAGMPLKGTPNTTVHDLATDAADWLGFVIRAGAEGLAVTVGERSWDRLAEHLALAHCQPDAPLRANAIIRGWLSQLGPCFVHEDRDDVCRRIAALASWQAFDEIPGPAELEGIWQRAYARWCKLRQRKSC